MRLVPISVPPGAVGVPLWATNGHTREGPFLPLPSSILSYSFPVPFRIQPADGYLWSKDAARGSRVDSETAEGKEKRTMLGRPPRPVRGPRRVTPVPHVVFLRAVAENTGIRTDGNSGETGQYSLKRLRSKVNCALEDDARQTFYDTASHILFPKFNKKYLL